MVSQNTKSPAFLFCLSLVRYGLTKYKIKLQLLAWKLQNSALWIRLQKIIWQCMRHRKILVTCQDFKELNQKKIIQRAIKIGDFSISGDENLKNADRHNFSGSHQKVMRFWETFTLIVISRQAKSECPKKFLWKVTSGRNFLMNFPPFHNFSRDNQATTSDQSLREIIMQWKKFIS